LIDPNRHQAPLQGQSNACASLPTTFAEFIERVNALTDIPRLTPDQYEVLFEELAHEVNENGFSPLLPLGKTIRDRCQAREKQIARSNVNWVIRGVLFGGYNLSIQERPIDPKSIAEAFHKNALALLNRAQAQLTAEEEEMLQSWLLLGCKAAHGRK